VQLAINSFPEKIFPFTSVIFCWLLVNSLVFPWQMSCYLIFRFSRQAVTLIKSVSKTAPVFLLARSRFLLNVMRSDVQRCGYARPRNTPQLSATFRSSTQNCRGVLRAAARFCRKLRCAAMCFVKKKSAQTEVCSISACGLLRAVADPRVLWTRPLKTKLHYAILLANQLSRAGSLAVHKHKRD